MPEFSLPSDVVVWTCTTAPSVTYRYVGTATITVTGGGGGSAELPSGGAAGSLLQRVGTTGAGWMARNVASGYAGVEAGGSIPEAVVPGTIARDTEVAAAITAALEAPIDAGTFS